MVPFNRSAPRTNPGAFLPIVSRARHGEVIHDVVTSLKSRRNLHWEEVYIELAEQLSRFYGAWIYIMNWEHEDAGFRNEVVIEVAKRSKRFKPATAQTPMEALR
jgi:hypothetical protein